MTSRDTPLLRSMLSMRDTVFPALGKGNQHRLAVFADNSSRAQMPATTLIAVATQMECWETHRGGNPDWDSPRAAKAAALRARAREVAAEFCGGTPGQIGFAANGTSTVAILARAMFGSVLKAGDTIVITEADHDANRLPWQELAALGCKVIDVPLAQDGSVERQAWLSAMEQRPKVVALCMLSNVTGVLLPYAELAGQAKAAGAVVVLDAVQGPPHGYTQIMIDGVDAAIFSNCKLFSPHLGWWAIRPELLQRMRLTPPVASHPSLEWGTFAHSAYAGFVATFDYFRGLAEDYTLPAAMAAVREHEAMLTERFLVNLPEAARGALLACETRHQRVPIFSLALPAPMQATVRSLFFQAGIDARLGQFGCPATLKRLAAHAGDVALRLSFVHYNSSQDVDRVCETLARLWKR